MKRVVLLLFIVLVACIASFFLFPPEPPPLVQKEPAVPGPLFDVVTIKLAEQNLKMYSTNSEGEPFRTFAALSAELGEKGEELEFATNGGIFMEDLTPLGLYIENGEEKRPINLHKDLYGNFYLQPNGVFYIQEQSGGVVATDDFSSIENVQFATQSGPMLLVNGNVNPLFDPESQNTHIRSGACFPTPHEATFIISNRPVTFFTFAEAFLEAGCKDALYLDGAISSMYAPVLGRSIFGLEYAVIIAATARSSP